MRCLASARGGSIAQKRRHGPDQTVAQRGFRRYGKLGAAPPIDSLRRKYGDGGLSLESSGPGPKRPTVKESCRAGKLQPAHDGESAQQLTPRALIPRSHRAPRSWIVHLKVKNGSRFLSVWGTGKRIKQH